MSGNVQRKILYWYTRKAITTKLPKQIATAQRQRAERLTARLHELGESID